MDSAAAGAISASLIVAFVGVFLVIAIVVIIYRQRKKRTWKKNTSEMYVQHSETHNHNVYNLPEKFLRQHYNIDSDSDVSYY